MFAQSSLRFAAILRRRPRHLSIKELFAANLGPDKQAAEESADDILVVRLLATLPEESALRSNWQVSCQISEEHLIEVIAERLGRSRCAFEVRLCAATVTAAIRIVDETVSLAAVKHGLKTTTAEVNADLAQAIRKASPSPSAIRLLHGVGRPAAASEPKLKLATQQAPSQDQPNCSAGAFSGMRAIALISKSNPASQFTPIAVHVG
ncbi:MULTISPECIES: hypothetical protein [Hyphomicrobiales]|uniref:hypothetical protein n=1 Tax=Methylobacterium sp. CCH7-A2 TaxID=1768789 RepID=UPI0012E33283|nr:MULTISPECIES: hypothetical protein [Hyphomicrobiales]